MPLPLREESGSCLLAPPYDGSDALVLGLGVFHREGHTLGNEDEGLVGGQRAAVDYAVGGGDIHHGLPAHRGKADGGHGHVSGLGLGSRQVLLLDDAALVQLLQIGLLGGSLAGSRGNDAVILHVDQRVELDKPLGILQHHDIGGLGLHVDEGGERGHVLGLLYLTLGRAHGGILLGADDGVVLVLTRTGVGEDETDVGLVAGDRGHAGVVPHVVTADDVAVAVGGHLTVAVTDDGVPEAAAESAVPIVLIAGKVTVENVVDPSRGIGHGVQLRGAVAGVEDDDFIHVHSAEQAHVGLHAGHDEEGIPLVIHLEVHRGKDFSGVRKAELTPKILVEVGAVHVDHGGFELHVLGVVPYGIHHDVAGHAGGEVIEPAEEIHVLQVGYLLGGTAVVDLVVVVAQVVLGDHVGKGAQLAVAQLGGRGGIHERNIGHHVGLGHILVKLGLLHRNDVGIAAGVEEGGGEQITQTDDGHGNGQADQQDHHGLVLFELEGGDASAIFDGLMRPGHLKATQGDHHGHADKGRGHGRKDPKLGAEYVDGGEHQVVDGGGQNKTDDHGYRNANGFFHEN